MSGVRSLVAGAALFATLVADAEIVPVDVGAWGDTGTGLTAEGWSVNGLGLYSGTRNAKFDAKTDSALSPSYGRAVTQVVVTAYSSASSTRPLRIVPVDSVADAPSFELEFSTDAAPQFFAWDAASGVRQFNVVEAADGSGNGYWGVVALEVFLDNINPPSGLGSTAAWRDSFDAAWSRDAQAVRDEVELARVVTTPAGGETLRRWDFSPLENGKGNPVDWKNAEIPPELSDVSGENLYLPTGSVGVVQIGKDNASGTLSVPVVESSRTLAFVFLASRYAGDDADGKGTVQFRDAAGVTNAEEEIFLTTERQAYAVTVPAEARTVEIVSEKARRIWLSEAEIIADYSPETVETNVVRTVTTRRQAFSFRDLEPGDWRWRVRSFDSKGGASAWSPSAGVTLLPDAPSRVPGGFHLNLR